MEPAIKYNGRFTIDGPKGHRTFKIKTGKQGRMKGIRMLGLLTGPDNTSDYKFFATVHDDRIQVWERSRSYNNELYARMLWSLATLGERSELVGMGYTLLIEKRCRKCNRPLTHPESIESGIGPECSGRGYSRVKSSD